jgi:hypothetical protein
LKSDDATPTYECELKLTHTRWLHVGVVVAVVVTVLVAVVVSVVDAVDLMQLVKPPVCE